MDIYSKINYASILRDDIFNMEYCVWMTYKQQIGFTS